MIGKISSAAKPLMIELPHEALGSPPGDAGTEMVLEGVGVCRESLRRPEGVSDLGGTRPRKNVYGCLGSQTALEIATKEMIISMREGAYWRVGTMTCWGR